MKRPKLYRIDQVSEMLNVSVYKVESLCDEMTLEKVNINPNGKRPTYRVTDESITKLIEQYPHLIKTL